MKFSHAEPLKMNIRVLMNRLGYHEQTNRRANERSYVRRLRGMPYPRFHCYVRENNTGLQFNLHLDEKQPSYHNQTAHSGQYEGDLVTDEAARIKSFLASV